jgi:uncharacterized protein
MESSSVHSFTCLGERMALDVETGTVLCLDEVSYALLPFFPDFNTEEALASDTIRGRFSEEEVRDSVREIQELIDEGLLFTKPIPTGEEPRMRGEPVIKAMCLHAAHDCNLSCAYCFASEGQYSGERSLLSYETGRKALEFLIARSGNRRFLEVDFFGGEPLLNWDTVLRLVSYGRQLERESGKVFRFTVTTNGMLLEPEMTEALNREFSNVVVSLDGRPSVHDRMRRTKTAAYSHAEDSASVRVNELVDPPLMGWHESPRAWPDRALPQGARAPPDRLRHDRRSWFPHRARLQLRRSLVRVLTRPPAAAPRHRPRR